MPGRFVDRRELVETAAAQLEVLDVDLELLSRDMDLSAAPRPWAVSLQGHPGNAMLFENPVDGGGRDVDLVVPLQEEADPERTVLALATDLEDQGNDVRRGGERTVARATMAVVETHQPLLAVAFTPAVEELHAHSGGARGASFAPGALAPLPSPCVSSWSSWTSALRRCPVCPRETLLATY